MGREASPSAAVLDSQSGKSAERGQYPSVLSREAVATRVPSGLHAALSNPNTSLLIEAAWDPLFRIPNAWDAVQ